MKYLLTLLFLASFFAYGQEPPYTPMRLNYQFRGIRVDSLFLIPSYADTNAANGSLSKKIAGSFIRTGNDFWMRNSDTTAWLQNVNVGSGASPTLNFVNNVFKKSGTDSVFYVVAPADTFFSFQDLGVDTTSLSNRINLKVDSLKRSNDSVYFKRNGVWSFAYKDSLGQPVNFANTNLRAIGNRQHSFANYNLKVDSIGWLNFTSRAVSKTGIIDNYQGEIYINCTDASDGSISKLEALTTGTFVGGTKFGEDFGLKVDADNSIVTLQRASNIAYLPTTNFGTDTIALKSDITGGTDSPDRIDGNATGNVVANMRNNNFSLDSSLSIRLESASNSYAFPANTILNSDPYSASLLTTNYLFKQNGISFNLPAKELYLANNSNLAYLSKKNFVSDTLAMLGDLTSLRKVDTIYRTSGNDSIFFKISGTTYKIKDSTSSYLGDSPDRINGGATGEVKSDMQGYDLSIYDATEISLFSTDSLLLGNSGGINLGGGSAISVVAKADSVIIAGGDVKVGGGNTIITTNNDLTLDANNSGENIKIDAAERVKLGNYSLGTNRVGHIKYAYKKADIVMTTSDDTAHIPGTYIIKTASTTNTFYLPDAAEFPGQTIYLINFDVSVDSNIGSLGGSIYDAAQTTPSTILTTSFNIFTSDGKDWWFTYNQP